jgi:hypothetical protein
LLADRSSWTDVRPKTPLNGPKDDALTQLRSFAHRRKGSVVLRLDQVGSTEEFAGGGGSAAEAGLEAELHGRN